MCVCVCVCVCVYVCVCVFVWPLLTYVHVDVTSKFGQINVLLCFY